MLGLVPGRVLKKLGENIRVTNDFRITLKRDERSRNLSGRTARNFDYLKDSDRYLRPVNSLLLVEAEGRSLVVCATDKEAGRVLAAIHSHGREFHISSTDATKNKLMVVTHIPNSPCLMPVNAAGEKVSDDILRQKLSPAAGVALQLFNGESKFHDHEGRAAVRRFLEGETADGRATAADVFKAIRVMRGRENEFERSDLDEILKGMGVEASF